MDLNWPRLTNSTHRSQKSKEETPKAAAKSGAELIAEGRELFDFIQFKFKHTCCLQVMTGQNQSTHNTTPDDSGELYILCINLHKQAGLESSLMFTIEYYRLYTLRDFKSRRFRLRASQYIDQVADLVL